MKIVKSPTVTWIDTLSPSQKDIHLLVNDFRVPSLAATQLKSPTLRPLIEHFDILLYIVLHFPMYNEEKLTSENAEIDFIITPTLLITARYQAIEPLEKLLKRYSYLPTKQNEYVLERGPMFLFYYIVKDLFRFSLRQVEHIHEKISDIEEGIFQGREREMVSRISVVRRDIIHFMSSLKPQRMVLENLLYKEYFMDEHTKPYITELLYEYDKVFNLIETEKETIEALHETNESLLNDKTNEIMKILTIMAFVTFPLSLLAAIFSLETATAPPIIGLPFDFWIIVGIMAGAMTGFFVFFKHKKWI